MVCLFLFDKRTKHEHSISLIQEKKMKNMIEDALALGTLMGLSYVVLVWGSIGEALAGI